MNFLLIIQALYILLLIGVVVRILFDTQSATKTAAYVLLVLLVPVVGILVYLSFGLNYRKRGLYSKKLLLDEAQSERINRFTERYEKNHFQQFVKDFPDYTGVNQIVYQDDKSFTTQKNEVNLYINGEQKFPEVLKALQNARHHIHIEYYIYENDTIGNQIADVLIAKAKQGVTVRFVYDDFGSSGIRKKFTRRLRQEGVEAFPFYKVRHPIYFANRLNYRNHRKIIIVDGACAFVGGINVSDKYINNGKHKLFWRDTHLKVKGEAVWNLQKIFLADWNFCAGQNIVPDENLFRNFDHLTARTSVQVAASGPDSRFPTILYSYVQAVASAKKEVMITTPYFVPGDSLVQALKMAALRGVKVQLLAPGVSDSYFVNAVSKSHYEELLAYGVEIFLYRKGFVHAKTMVCDGCLSVIGTANLDSRSFDLNFEVNGIVYNNDFADALRNAFLQDLPHSEKLEYDTWHRRKFSVRFVEKLLRLVSPLL